MTTPKIKMAFWFRYGLGGHVDLCASIPGTILRLAEKAEIHVFGLRSGRPIPEALRGLVTLHEGPCSIDRTNPRDKARKSLFWLALLPWVGLRCRRLGIRLVYMDETLPLGAILGRLFYRGRMAMTVADCFADIYLDRNAVTRSIARGLNAADRRSWRSLDLIFTRAKNARDALARQGVDPARVRTLYNPCDFGLYHPKDRAACRARFGYAPEHIVLVHHGVLHPNKGNDRILRALAAFRETQPRLRFLLVGDGPEGGRLRALARELQLEDRVQFTGWLPSAADVNDALNAADIGLVMRVGHASDDWHVTDTLVHAMACGLPVLAARLKGVSEIVRDGESGYLFAPDDPEEFTERLLLLAGDADLRARCGQNALALARELFDTERIAQATADALLELVS